MANRKTGVSLYCLCCVVWERKEGVWSSAGGSDDDSGEVAWLALSNSVAPAALRDADGSLCLYFFVPYNHVVFPCAIRISPF